MSEIVETVQVDIDRPVGEVFEFLTDARNHPVWDTSSVQMQPDEVGPWRAGLEFREVRRIGPRQVTVRSRIAAIDAPHGMDIESVSGPPFTGTWRLEEHLGGTRLRWTGRIRLPGTQRLLRPLIARSFRRTSVANFARLKSVVETASGLDPRVPAPHRRE